MKINIIAIVLLSILSAREVNINLEHCDDVKSGLQIYADDKKIGEVISINENCDAVLNIKKGYDNISGSTIFKVEKKFRTVFLILDMEETKRVEEARLAAEAQEKAEEVARLAAEAAAQEKAEEVARLAAEAAAKAKAEEEARLAAEAAAKLKAEEEARLAAEAAAKAEEEARLAAEAAAKAVEEAKLDAEDQAKTEKEARLAAEAQAKVEELTQGGKVENTKLSSSDSEEELKEETSNNITGSDEDVDSLYDNKAKLKKNIFGNSTLKVKYPKIAKRDNLEGACVVKFYIDASGQVSELRLIESSGHEILDDAALKAIKKTKWKPATKDGVKVGSWSSLPVKFELD